MLHYSYPILISIHFSLQFLEISMLHFSTFKIFIFNTVYFINDKLVLKCLILHVYKKQYYLGRNVVEISGLDSKGGGSFLYTHTHTSMGKLTKYCMVS